MKKIVAAAATKQAIKHMKSGKINGKKLLLVGGGLLVVGLIGLVLFVVLAVLVIRWAWNAGSDQVQTNPTVSNIVESSKDQLGQLLPSVPATASDFIVNGEVNQQRIEEVYAGLPTETQAIWKRALEESITQELENATGLSAQTLRDLQAVIIAL
jgi:hypothetical protein